jgi:hypothetical protein
MAQVRMAASDPRGGAGATVGGKWRRADGPLSAQRGGGAALAPRPSRKKLVRLVNKGLSDAVIGRRYRRAPATVAKWRQAEGLERPRGSRPPRQELKALLVQGLSDRTIGQRYGVKTGTVRIWRYDYELARVDPAARPSRETLAGLISQGLSDASIGQRYGRAAMTVAGWRSKDGLRRERPGSGVDPVRELRRQGLPAPDVAAELGCTTGQVYRASRTPKAARQQARPPPATTGPTSPTVQATGGLGWPGRLGTVFVTNKWTGGCPAVERGDGVAPLVTLGLIYGRAGTPPPLAEEQVWRVLAPPSAAPVPREEQDDQ